METITQEVAPAISSPMAEGQLPAVRKDAASLITERPSAPPATIPELTVKKIAGAIAAVMNEVGIVAKAGFNEFHRYKYAAMQDVLQKLTPLLAKHGLCIIQTEISRAMFDSDRVIAVQYQFTILHTSGEVWPDRPIQSGMSRCRDSKGGFDDKALNKCHTAARKYFLLALFQVATGDEDDADREDAPRTRPVRRGTTDIADEVPEYPSREAENATERAGAATDDSTRHAVPEPPHERTLRLDNELSVAAENGTDDLRRAWLLIPPKDRPPLEEALRRRHKPRAAEVDAAKQP